MKTLQEFLTEALVSGRFKTAPIVNKIIKKPAIQSICKEITTKLESFGFSNLIIEPDKRWEVFNMEKGPGLSIVLPLNTKDNDGEYYLAEYGGDAIKQFDKEFKTKETNVVGLLCDSLDVTDKFRNIPEHVHVYARNCLCTRFYMNGKDMGKFNHPEFDLVIPVNEVQDLWDEING